MSVVWYKFNIKYPKLIILPGKSWQSPLINRVVSSANRVKSNSEDELHMSFIYSKNSKGPRVDPWGDDMILRYIEADVTSVTLNRNRGRSPRLRK